MNKEVIAKYKFIKESLKRCIDIMQSKGVNGVMVANMYMVFIADTWECDREIDIENISDLMLHIKESINGKGKVEDEVNAILHNVHI